MSTLIKASAAISSGTASAIHTLENIHNDEIKVVPLWDFLQGHVSDVNTLT